MGYGKEVGVYHRCTLQHQTSTILIWVFELHFSKSCKEKVPIIPITQIVPKTITAKDLYIFGTEIFTMSQQH